VVVVYTDVVVYGNEVDIVVVGNDSYGSDVVVVYTDVVVNPAGVGVGYIDVVVNPAGVGDGLGVDSGVGGGVGSVVACWYIGYALAFPVKLFTHVDSDVGLPTSALVTSQ
jgi:hypothetical protein